MLGQREIANAQLTYITLPEGFNLLSARDIGMPFNTAEALMEKYDLEYYYKRSLHPGTLVLVRKEKDKIAGIALLTAQNSRLIIEMLVRNQHNLYRGAGGELLKCIEGCVAEQLNVFEIRLEALDRAKLIEFYKKNGYVPDGPPVDDKEWGKLHPMKKRIASYWA